MTLGRRIAVATAVLVVAAGLADHPVAAQAPTLSVQPGSGPAETRFTARGNGFPACPGGFGVQWDAPAVRYAGDPQTHVAVAFVPLRAGVGGHRVTALCVTGDNPPQTLTATATFAVTPTPTTVTTALPVPSPPVLPLPRTVPGGPVATAPGPTFSTVTTAPLLDTATTTPQGAPGRARRTAIDTDDEGLPLVLVILGFLAFALALFAVLMALGRRRREVVDVETAPTEVIQLPPKHFGEVADELLGGGQVPPLTAAGPAAARFGEAFGDDAVATPVLATLVWEAFVTDPRYGDALRAAGASDRAARDGQPIVVRHAGDTRHDLLVLDPGFTGEEPVSAPVEVWPAASTAGSRRAVLSWDALLTDGMGTPWSTLDEATVVGAIEEVAGTERFGVIVAAPPEVLLTQVPSPAWPVVVQRGRAPVATVGAVVRAADGSVAVTTALHAVKERSSVSVAGRPGTVTATHEPTDSCLIAVADLPPYDSGRGRGGPLRGVTPRQHEQVAFEGVSSGRTTTVVMGWEPSIFAPHQHLGSKVYTRAVTVPGDSGAALVDEADRIVGFATYRSAFGERIDYSVWVWAAQVLGALGARFPAGDAEAAAVAARGQADEELPPEEQLAARLSGAHRPEAGS